MPSRTMKQALLALLILQLGQAHVASAALTFQPKLFSSGMILQRGTGTKVFGTGECDLPCNVRREGGGAIPCNWRLIPCNVRREGGKTLVTEGSSLVMLEGREGKPL